MNALDLAYIPIAAVTAPLWAGKKRAGWRERFGACEPLPAKRAGLPRVMLHAVSVGEVSALRYLVPLLVGRAEVVVSASTDTGLKRAKELFGSTCRVVRYPLDFSWSVRRVLDAVSPDLVALVELEVWPNFVGECKRRGVPMCVINGRLSERSFRGYNRIRSWFGRVLSKIDMIAAQDEDYARRFRALGVDPAKCRVTGSMKWDAAKIEETVAGADRLAAELGIDLSRPLVVAGSTGPGEEALMVAACPPGAQLLCAPRKPERFNEAAGVMSGCVRRSARVPGSGTRYFLLDTIGELRQAYALATVVVMGRSFGNLYGSDPIEPIALGKATVIGPAVSDFAQIVAAFEHDGGIVRSDPSRLAIDLARLVADEGERREIAARGRACILANQGASHRHADLILSMTASPTPAAVPPALGS
ncbi:MAG: hypothetical protein JSR77_02855 [Planctomycetes bacterium]|nr:hypothetical protein [Planctomycetota bacterium]